MSCGGRGRGRGRGHHEHSHHGRHGFEGEFQAFTGMLQPCFHGTGVMQLTIPPEVSNPVIQPSIPYVGPIAGGIRPGTRLHVEGTVPHNAKQFQINFKTGVKDADDVAFHFNPRFGHYVYMNIFRNGKWQKEELGPDKPFVKGLPFKLLFIINKDSYEVHVNGTHFYTFSHRIPFDIVTTLAIVGDVTIYWLGFEKLEVPSLFKESKTILMGCGGWTYIPLVVSNLASNLTVPCGFKIPEGKKEDMAVVFQGTVPANADRFAIDFQTGPPNDKDVAFHYNPRMGWYTAMNSFRNGNWGKEETVPDKPFTRGGAFIILVVFNSEGYEVYVNGSRHCTFKHRIPLEKVVVINIWGTVSLLLCGFIESWSTTSSFKELKKITTTQGLTPSVTSMPFEISHPVNNPALPYVAKIPGGLKQDMAVFLQGTVLADAKSFVFNFKTGPSDGDDIAFHYNPRAGDYTFLNSRRNGSWEKEETAPDKSFTKGGAFQMFIAVTSDGYEVYVNGLKQCTFKHRIPLEKVSVVHLYGDVSLLICGLIHKWKSPSFTIQEKQTLLMGSGTSTFIPLEISDPISNQAVPCMTKISPWIKQDTAVVFQGTLPTDATGFTINFKTGPADTDDIAFHCNTRIGDGTYLNSFRNGNWEKEETVPDKPFTRGGAFIILVVINSEGYEVYVNGLKHCTFKHRIPLEKVTTLNVYGTVSLLVWGYINSWSTTSSFKELKKIITTQGPTPSVTSMPFEISHPVNNPALPYVAKIPGGLKQDMAVFLQGTVLADAKSFVFSFKTGPSDGDDIAFHYNPRAGDYTFLNSRRNGSWEKEETAPDKSFTKGGAFQMFIAVTSDGYEVYVNGLKQCTFKHRIPLEKVSVVHLYGDVSLLICGLIHKWKSPSFTIQEKKTLLMGSGTSTFIPLEISDPISNQAVPCMTKISPWIKQDIAVVFQGTLPTDATKFTINFKTGPADSDDIAFHYNPRIGDGTYLNSFRNGNWEKEETVPDKPFTRGGAFIILVVINSEGYEVYVNGLKHCTFKHRIPLEKVTTLNVYGTVSLLVWGYINSWSTTSSFKELKKIITTQGPTPSVTSMPFEISHPVNNPALPYVAKIPGGLKQDMAVFLQGTVLADAKSFVFNFKTGPSDGDDIAFHYNPRAGDYTFLNSRRNGSWEKEETAPDKSFTKGGAFQMFIAVTSDGYEVYVNGLKQCTFKHRIPLEKVSVVHLYGDVSLLICGLIHKWKSPSFTIQEKQTLLMGSGTSTFIPLEISDPISNQAVPCMTKISPWIKQDIAVVFQGTLPTDATGFTINFKTGPADTDDIAFHCNTRIGDGTYLNSFRNGNWEKEETVPDKPFTRGGAFIILVVINSEGYEVYVNGLKHCTFKHRIPLEKVTTLNVYGTVSLLVWGYINSWSTTSSFKELKKIITTQGPTPSVTSMPFEISHPVNNPALPYVAKIPGGLKQDMAVFLQGTVLADAKSFVFSFKTGPSDGDDIAFHYNPRAGDYTFLNSRRNGSWEKEETAPDKSFTKGGAFQMFIAVTSDGYEVYVNGLKQCTFKHRIPLEKVSVVHLYGDVSLLICGLIHKWKSPSFTIQEKKTLLMGSGTSTFIPLEISDPISNQAVPCMTKISPWIKQDIAVVFQGTLPTDATGFTINFKTGPADSDDIAFHYNPRIGDGTYLNSFRNGNWEKEETVPDKPFTRGGAFIILVVINSEGYEVYVNGLKHCTFKHRIPLEKVTTLNVYGTVSLLVWGYINSWSTTSSFKELKKIITTHGPTPSVTSMPFEISHPVNNPALPYVAKIPGGLKQDMAVFLQGTVLADAKSFVFNFKTGPSDGDDIAFHYNPRAGDYTFLNSRRNGSWEKEETAPDKSFTKGGAFQMFIAVTSDGYEVYVNGLKQCTFKHRIPLEKVSVVHLYGDVSLLICGLIHKWKSPSFTIQEKKTLLMGSGTSTFIPLEISDPISNQAVPCMTKISPWIKQDIAVVFQGSLPTDATGFTINFKTGPADSDDIAFHCNTRIGDGTYLNSFRNGNWEKEEIVPDKPFTRGGAFIILVVINSEGYEVYVNGLKHCTFKHRIPLEKVTTLNVYGTVSLLVWGYINSWSTTSSFKELKKIITTQGPTPSVTSMPFEISHPVNNPALPYVAKIPGGLKQDMAVFLQGTVLADAKSFVFNFKTGPSDGDDIAFHYNPRAGDYTFLNSRRNGSWEKEETAPDKSFTKGGAFQMFIAVTSDGYEVYVNGLKQCTFKHRIPLEKVSVVHLYGDVSLLICGLIHKWKSPSFTIQEKKTLLMGSGTSTFIPLEISDPISNQAVPCMTKISPWIKQDIAVVFQGTLPTDATKFTINFKTGPADSDDIAFHYNPRIGDGTYLNSFRNGNWEKEETVPDKPFTRGGAFIILVVINSEGYEVYVNGLKHCTFKHRIPLEKVTTLNVYGTVSLLVWGYINSWSTTSSFKELKKIITTQGPTPSVTSMPFEISHPVNNPALPYVAKIPGGLKQDMAVFLQGTVLADAKSFVFNFKTGPSDGDDIAFHYNPRAGDYTFLNSRRNGSWEKEETAPDKSFTKGGAFQMFIAVTSDGYEVYVNGLKQCTFKHRIPLEKVSVVHLYGDVSLLICGLIHKWKSPSFTIQEKQTLLMGSGTSTFIPLEISDPISNQAVPCMTKISPWIKQDIAVVFQGTLPTDATGFTINFKTGPADSDDIAFHYNPRIGDGTYLNSFRNGNWEKEETVPDKPFTRGGAFIILVVINSEGYEVYVNGLKHCTFKHRIPLEKVTTLNVYGTVSLLVWGYINSWSTTSSFKELKKIITTQGPTPSVTSMPFEISHPVNNPALPYVAKIPGGLKQDMAVFLQGTVLADAKSFVFNFKTGPSDGDDIAFHYNPRAGDYTFLNSRRNGSWEKEETAPDKSFTKGGAFQMFIAVTSDGYEVYVNGLKQCTFKHRIPLEKVSVVHLYGDVSLLICGLIHKWKSPSFTIQEKKTLLMGSGTSTFIPLEISDPISNQALPCMTKISPWIKQDIAVVFQGTLPTDATKFTINFKTGPADSDDIAFHYNPRIGDGTYLNSFRNGNWEKEETVPDKPFTRGGAFIILVVINSEGYEVYVNGLKHCTFKHRIPLEKVTTLNVYGTVSLLVWGYINSWSTTSSFKELKKIITTQGPTPSVTSMPFEISHPVNNPALPYVAKIPGGLKQDMAVFLQGTVLADAKSFVFNFKTGPSDGDDIAFHYNPRAGDYTFLNSRRNGSWEKEETAPDKSFTKGGAFQMFIAVTSDGYEVYVNGLKQCTFKHRIPLEKVSVVHLYGDVSLLICGLIHKWKSPSFTIQEKKTLLMGSGTSTFIPLEISDPISNQALPCMTKISPWIKQDIAVVFQGTLPTDATKFTINFKTGPADSDDIAFHYNPRIGDGTYLNSFRNGNWEKEETVPDKPFTRGGAFIILVVINSEGYEVYVNGLKHCTFKHRIPLEKVTTLNVYGTVSLLVWGYINSWSTTSSFKELKKIITTQGPTPSVTSMPFEISHPVNNPALPYVAKIPGGLKQDMAVFLQGTVLADAKSFVFNFKTGPSDGDDIAFHYNPRAGDYTFLNSRRNGSWEKEETAPDKSFTKGGAFQMFIAVTSDGYEVYVNGLKQCTFKHRIPLEKVSVVHLYGDVSLLICGLIHKWKSPSFTIQEKKTLLMGSGTSTFIPLEISDPISNQAVPCMTKISPWIKQDIAVVFQGTLPTDATGFTINFKTGPADSDDIAFHCNTRIGDGTYLNSFRNGNWEKEETVPDKPFTRGGAFIILVVINSEGYEVYVNGLKHCTFKHRIPLEKVTTLNVYGTVSLLVWGYINSWSTTSSFKELKKIITTQGPTPSVTSMPFEISHPVNNPALPYVAKIPGGLKQDMAVFLQGTVLADAKSFVFNFKTGPSDGDDIAFHYNPRAGDYTFLNSRRNGSWEKEETAPDKSFTKGGAFQMFIAVTSDGYEVYVNGLKQCTFKHRIPLEKVSVVHLYGDVSLLICGLIHKWKSPSLFIKEKKTLLMGSGISTFVPLEISDPICNPALPCVAKIPQGIKEDIAVVFQGTVPADATGFAINFKMGPAEGDDVAFHYNPRIGDRTILNSFRNRNFEKEETVPDKPFTRGGAFIILVVINSEGYEVYVNGLKHCTFKHRIPLEKVTTVDVRGTVSLLVCGFIDSWSTTSSFKELKKITTTQGPTSSLTSLPLEISHPIIYPALPYVVEVPGGINQDKAVFFQGTVPADAKSFTINFKTGPADADDIAFHYNPRIGDHTTLNSVRNGSWETEETAPDKPFTAGQTFQLIVAVNSEGYEVYVNGLRHCTFKHRIPLEKVSTIGIGGDLSNLICGLMHSWRSSSFYTELQKIAITEISPSVETTALNISHPITNPALPYVGKIPGGIQKDMAVFFQGTIPQDAKGFVINFKTGLADADDIAFHYNPRIGDHTTLNSVRNGSWETEETAPDKPFTAGQTFQLIIVINSEGYEVYVNGLRHCTFKHRIPLEKVSTLGIGGDLSNVICGFIHSWTTSSFFTELQEFEITGGSSTSLESTALNISHPITNPALPYVGKIPGGIQKDMAVFFQGTIPQDAKGFIINFKTGPADADDIAFHYNLRTGDHTTLNSFRNGSWETEETAPDKPFTAGQTFQLIIVINSESYEVYVNGLKHCVFKHRISLEQVSTLGIEGDVLISICGFIHNWSASSIFTEIQQIQSTTSTTITLEISQPISNPAIPYVGKIPIVVKPNVAVLFQGSVLENAVGFEINFKTGSSDDAIAFQFKPHMGEYTALNSFRNGIWEKQENVPIKPFTKGGAFQIIVVFKSEGYEVYVNGLKYCTFKHRIPLEKVCLIGISGETTIQLIGFVENWSA